MEGRGVPPRREEREVEGLVHLAGAHVPREPLERFDPRLGDQRAVAVVGGEHPVPGAVDFVDTLLVEHGTPVDRADRAVLGRRLGALDHRDLPVPVGQARGLHQAVSHVDPEAVHALVEPEPQHVLELGAHLGVLPVEVRLTGVEQVQVPLAVG